MTHAPDRDTTLRTAIRDGVLIGLVVGTTAVVGMITIAAWHAVTACGGHHADTAPPPGELVISVVLCPRNLIPIDLPGGSEPRRPDQKVTWV
jgi:hypothetical protein